MGLRQSLSTLGIHKKLALLFIIAALVFCVVLIGIINPLLHKVRTDVITQHQKELLTVLQTQIDAHIESAKAQLQAVAETLPSHAVEQPSKAQAFLESQVGIATLFDNGLTLLSPEGRLLAQIPRNENDSDIDFSAFPLFKHIKNTERLTLSAPYKSRKPPYHPVVQFCNPVHDESGKLIALFSGAMRLDGDNVISSVADMHLGDQGYMYLFDTQRRILVHPQRGRILKQDIPSGDNTLFGRALSGWEGTGECVTSSGEKMVTSIRQLDGAPWILASNLPMEEAFIPSRKASAMLAVLIVGLAASGGIMVLLLLRSITTPLSAFSSHLQELKNQDAEKRQFPVNAHMSHEVEVLALSFNELITTEDEQRTRLKDKAAELEEKTAELTRQVEISQQREQELQRVSSSYHNSVILLQNISDNVPDLIWAKDLENRYIFTNKANNETLLLPDHPEQPIGKTHEWFIQRILEKHAGEDKIYDFGPQCDESDAETLDKCQTLQFLEQGYVLGKYICLDVYKSPLYDINGTLMGTVGCARIVTREKQLERKAARLSHLHWLRSKINHKIAHNPEPIKLFKHVCDLLMSDPGCVGVSVCMLMPDNMIVPIASAGIDSSEMPTFSEAIACLKDRKTIISGINSSNAADLLPPAMADLKQRFEFRTFGIFPIQPQKAHGAVLAVLSGISEHPLLHTDEQQLIDEIIGDLAFALDLALQQEIQQQTLQELKLAATVFANSIEAIIVTDADTNIISVNRAFSEITGYAENEVIGETPSMLKSDHHPDTFFKDMWRKLNYTGRWRGEIWNRRKNGQIYPASLSIACVYDASGTVSNYIGILNDISQIKESEQQLHYLQFHDPLSDLPNRSMFSDMLTEAIHTAREHHEHLALLCLDLDHFKDINDSYGFPAGDAILKQMSRRLDESISSSGKIARLGADEFVVLLEGVKDDQEVSMVAEQILHMMEKPFVLDSGDQIQISTSIGMALYPQHGENALELLQKVDSAVYLSKQRGRNRFSFYNEENTAKAVERLELSNHLRHALEYDELKIHYQPQVNIQTGNVVGAEALMRWDSPKLGMVPPDRFIPLAEQLGCIIPMGEWILRSVCEQGRAWLDAGMPKINLAVNLSAIQFYQEDIVEVVQHILKDTGFPAEHLELEVTESLLMHKERQTITRLQKLKQLGVRLAMDDFGTGYSSLAYLKFFPLDVLKIDKSFVDDLPHGQADCKMVSAISQMGRGLGLTLLAEGVENRDQLDYLEAAGCTLYQGYFCSRPVPAEEFISLVLSTSVSVDIRD